MIRCANGARGISAVSRNGKRRTRSVRTRNGDQTTARHDRRNYLIRQWMAAARRDRNIAGPKIARAYEIECYFAAGVAAGAAAVVAPARRS